MVDIHTHVIPNVDDGSPSLEESIKMIKHEIEIGVDTIICTPHHIHRRYEKSVEEIKEKYLLLKQEVEKQNLKVNLLLGQEICYTTREDIIKMLEEGKLLTINDSKRVLLEFTFHREPEDIIDIVYNFGVHGYEVIVAHVERYEWMTMEKLKAIRQEGALIQVNSGAIVGKSGWKEKHFAKKAIKLGLVDFVASDIHSFRLSTLDKARKITKKPELFEYNV